MSDLLDFGGKYQYLFDLYSANINHSLLQQAVFYAFTLFFGLFTTTVILLVLSPFARDPVLGPQGCRRHGHQGKSHLSDELSPRHSPSTKNDSTKQSPARVQSLWLYPVKACRGVEVSSAEIIPTGILYDRQYSFAQLHSPFPLSITDSKADAAAHQWRFITQREFPLLSQVSTELWLPDATAPDYHVDAPYVKTGGAIILRFPYEADGLHGYLASLIARLRGAQVTKSFIIPVEPTPAQQKQFKIEPFKIWKDTPLSLNMGSLVPPELKYFLGVRNPLTLFRVHTRRELFRNAPRKAQLGWQPIAGFADAYPLNIMGLASLAALDAMQPRGSPPLGFLRFRGNIAVTGTGAFDEETWTKVRIGEGVYFVCCRCVRCGVPNVDPATGVKDRMQPYRTLVSKRNVDVGSPEFGCLGMQMVPVKPEGYIRLGDEIEVLETGEHVYEKM